MWQFGLGDELQTLVMPFAAGLVYPVLQARHFFRLHRAPQMAAAVINVKAMAFGQVLNFLRRPFHVLPQRQSVAIAQIVFQRPHVGRPAQYRLPAIAARSRPADAAGFYHGHIGHACFRQFQCGVQTAETCAYD